MNRGGRNQGRGGRAGARGQDRKYSYAGDEEEGDAGYYDENDDDDDEE